MRFFHLMTFMAAATLACAAGDAVSLDSCRQMALKSNRQLMISQRAIDKAHYQKEEALVFTPRRETLGSIFSTSSLLK